MRKKFWEVIYDRKTLSYEILGVSSDDTKLTFNVSEMIRAGMEVACNTPDAAVNKEDLTLPGYKIENSLYERLLTEYNKKTGKHLKRW